MLLWDYVEDKRHKIDGLNVPVPVEEGEWPLVDTPYCKFKPSVWTVLRVSPLCQKMQMKTQAGSTASFFTRKTKEDIDETV